MSRCEHEVINRINSTNVVDLLVLLHPASLSEHMSTEAGQRTVAKSIVRKAKALVGGEESSEEEVARASLVNAQGSKTELVRSEEEKKEARASSGELIAT